MDDQSAKKRPFFFKGLFGKQSAASSERREMEHHEDQGDFEFDSFFTRLHPKEDQREVDGPHRLKLQSIKGRQRLVEEHLSNEDFFSKYVEAHPLSVLIERKMTEEVSLHKFELALIAKEQGIAGLKERPVAEQYRMLAMTNSVDPSYVFPEFPSIAHLCELKDLSDIYLKINNDRNSEEQQLIKKEWNTAIAYFKNRWYVLTQEILDGLPFPPVSKLTHRIAPVPYSSSWSEELHSREARSMGHAPTLGDHDRPAAASSLTGTGNDGSSTGHPMGSAHSNAGSRTGAPDSGESSTEEEGSEEPSDGEESGTDSTTDAPCVRCDIEDIHRLAGAPPLRQPASGEARYTFPGTLRWGEDIFYDYAVMVPISQCDIREEIVGPEDRSLEAAMLSARFAKGLLDFLTTQNLAGTLGIDVVDTLHSVLDGVLNNTQLGAPTQLIRLRRKELKESAALCRSISRMRMFLSPISGTNPTQFVVALDQALAEFPWVSQRQRAVPSTDRNGEIRNALEVSDLNSPENQLFPDARDYDGEFGAPDARGGGPGAFHWIWETEFQNKKLRRYVEYLGSTFYRKLVALRDAASAMSNAVHTFAGQSTNVLAEFARLAEEVVNDVLMALGRLFDDIAGQLPLPTATNGEGSKRLALMVIFRQYWFPEGYVAGKLVGYKNLLPNQKEILKRRTFVKTTREVTTVQEFAASREEDFTHSSKETSELVKEASSQFNFSVSADGGFDILIASGDIKVENRDEWKNTSRAMHNRVAEATMKSSAKYNEKREVKIRELTEIEDVQEVTTELQNLNREITANYFYYQLHRQYFVTTELAHVQPVLLRTRDVPHTAAIDERFLADYAHILLLALPRQLSADLQETVGDIELLGRTLVRRRSDADLKRAMYEQFQQSSMPADAEGQSHWRAQLEALERATSESRTAYIEAEENYIRARTRLDRVISHVRENICYYMQFIWQASPKVDQDKLLQEENFDGRPLAEATRGYMRIGYYGNEEIFEYTGHSLECLNASIDLLIAGYQIVASLSDEELRQHPLFQRLKRYFPADTDEMIIERIRMQIFVRDPANPEEVFNGRRVQIAQDALVVDALPGQVPLLEAFQMAHRMLDVQKACLENAHLNERIKSRPWEQEGEDSYKILRREGLAESVNVQIGKDESE